MKKFLMMGLALALGTFSSVLAQGPYAQAKLSLHNVHMGKTVTYTIDVRTPFAVDSVKMINTFTLDGCLLDNKRVKFKPSKKKKDWYEYRVAKCVITPQHEGKYVIPSLGVRVYTTEPGEDGQPKAVCYDLKTLPVSFDADNFHYETHKAYGT